MLTGQYPHRLRGGGNLLAFPPPEFPVDPDLLEQSGYSAGYCDKGWGPGVQGDRKRNPAGPKSVDFAKFLASRRRTSSSVCGMAAATPTAATSPGRGLASGMRLEDVKVPKHTAPRNPHAACQLTRLMPSPLARAARRH